MLDRGNVFEEPLSVTRNYSLSLNIVCESIKNIFKVAIYCREKVDHTSHGSTIQKPKSQNPNSL